MELFTHGNRILHKEEKGRDATNRLPTHMYVVVFPVCHRAMSNVKLLSLKDVPDSDTMSYVYIE